jgi:hypothetical protein
MSIAVPQTMSERLILAVSLFDGSVGFVASEYLAKIEGMVILLRIKG